VRSVPVRHMADALEEEGFLRRRVLISTAAVFCVSVPWRMQRWG